MVGANAETQNWLYQAAADFRQYVFGGVSVFDSYIFPGTLNIIGCTFAGNTTFQNTRFLGNIEAANVRCQGEFRFDRCSILGHAVWSNAHFSSFSLFSDCRYDRALFFNCAALDGSVEFTRVSIAEIAVFDRTDFKDRISFDGTAFNGGVSFTQCRFDGKASFRSSQFSGKSVDAATFDGTIFSNSADFENAIFATASSFRDTRFGKGAEFRRVHFRKSTRFAQATFEKYVTFRDAQFSDVANFSAINAARAFSLEGARFGDVPNFIQASFVEAPRLDNLIIETHQKGDRLLRRLNPWLASFLGRNADIPARYRALKRLAIEGHDSDREQMFFAGEIRSARYATDWPLPLQRANWNWLPQWLNVVPFAFWRGSAWSGFYRFWFGLLYQLLGDFGRSVLRPLAIWVAVIATSTLYFLGQHEEVAKARAAMKAQGPLTSLTAYTTTSYEAWIEPQACVSIEKREKIRKEDGKEEEVAVVSPLRKPVRDQTNAATEAFHLAFRNAFIVLDGGADAAHRTYGCLYGVERYGDNPVAIVPSNVTWASGIQKAFSAVLIFLFGLALRNMLKMK